MPLRSKHLYFFAQIFHSTVTGLSLLYSTNQSVLHQIKSETRPTCRGLSAGDVPDGDMVHVPPFHLYTAKYIKCHVQL